MNPARTLEDPDERALPCGGAYALYMLTSLAEMDPHTIVRTDKHWEYRYPDLGSTWCGPLSACVLQLVLHEVHQKIAESYGLPPALLLGGGWSVTTGSDAGDRTFYDRLKHHQDAALKRCQAEILRLVLDIP